MELPYVEEVSSVEVEAGASAVNVACDDLSSSINAPDSPVVELDAVQEPHRKIAVLELKVQLTPKIFFRLIKSP